MTLDSETEDTNRGDGGTLLREPSLGFPNLNWGFDYPSPDTDIEKGETRGSSSPTVTFQHPYPEETPNSRSSNTSFRNYSTTTSKPSFLRAKTKSRLMDDPLDTSARSSGNLGVSKNTQLKSGFGGKHMDGGDKDDDPFFDVDLPGEFKKGKLNAWNVVQWASLFLFLTGLVCCLAVPAMENRTLFGLPLWKWDVMVLVLICGRLVSNWVMRIVVFLIQRNFLLKKRLLYFVYGVRKAVMNCLWLGLVLYSWHQLFDRKLEKETDSKIPFYATRLLFCLLVSTLVWLVKTFMIKVLASSFHVSTYFDRIQSSIFNQYVIETLSGPPLVAMQNAKIEEEKTLAEIGRLQNAGAMISPELMAAVAYPGQMGKLKKLKKGKDHTVEGDDDKITVEQLNKLNSKNVSAWNMKRLMYIVRHGVLFTLDKRLPKSTRDVEAPTQIRSEIEARASARKIFNDVAKPGSRFITWQDLLDYMREDEASKTMGLFEGAIESEVISKSALKNWMVNAFRERRALVLTLNDTRTAVKKLHNTLNIVVCVILVVAWLVILKIATTQILVFISSQVVLVAFIFGNTLKTIFEAIIFLFVMHPFDVGDRCEVENVEMVVEEMNILSTVFLRYDNLRITYPNSYLATKPISNFYRSPDMGDAVDFSIHIATPIETIAVMKQRITSYIVRKKEHWNPAPMIVMLQVDELNRLKMAVWLCHRMNHQDMGEKWGRRAQLVEEMVKIFKELDIEFRMMPMDVNVCSFGSQSDRLPPQWMRVSANN